MSGSLVVEFDSLLSLVAGFADEGVRGGRVVKAESRNEPALSTLCRFVEGFSCLRSARKHSESEGVANRSIDWISSRVSEMMTSPVMPALRIDSAIRTLCGCTASNQLDCFSVQSIVSSTFQLSVWLRDGMKLAELSLLVGLIRWVPI